MTIFNFPHCKEHCLQNKQTAIIFNIIEVLNISEHCKCVVELLLTSLITLSFTLFTMSLLSIRHISIFMIRVTLYRMLNKKYDYYCFALFM